MRVAMFADYPPSTAERVIGAPTPTINLARWLRELSVDVHIFTSIKRYGHSERGGSVTLGAGLTVHYVPVCKFTGMAMAHWPRVRRLQLAAAEVQPDLVHGQGTEKEYGFAAVSSRWPSVITMHGFLREVHRVTRPRVVSIEAVGERLEALVIRRARNFIAVSPYIESVVRGLLPEDAAVFQIPNAVDPLFRASRAGHRKTEDHTFVSMGSIYPLKGTLDTIHAAARMDRDGFRGTLYVVGKARGPGGEKYYRECRSVASQLSGFRVEFTGWLTPQEIVLLLSEATALIHSSRVENAPMAVAEALSAGRPIIARPVGAIEHMIGYGSAGRIVAGPADTAAAMRTLIVDDTEWRNMSIAARELSVRYLPQEVARKTLDAYRSILRA